MELNDWLAIIGGFGGLKAVRWGVTFWVNHKTNARKEDASADSMEDENKRKQVDWLEERIAQRDAKIDALYVKLRNEQSDKLAWIHKCHELELQLKDAEHNRCDRPDSECGRRMCLLHNLPQGRIFFRTVSIKLLKLSFVGYSDKKNLSEKFWSS